MPIYEYEYIDGPGPDGKDVIEVFQGINDEPLTVCPETGRPIRRIISTPSRSPKHGVPNNKRLGELGFTKYEKKGKGYYERVAGNQGPQTLQRKDED